MKTRVHRISNPLMCQYLWDAITTIRNHKQLPSFDRIRRYMNRVHNMDAGKVEKYLEEAATDNLIAVTRKLGQKGSKVGIEQEGFRLPTMPTEMDKHDWYCFDCHESGEIVRCTKCYRVFHPKCIKPSCLPASDSELFLCAVCKKRLQQRSSKDRLGREELNYLLRFIVEKLKDKLPLNMLERAVASNMPTKCEAPSAQASFEPWRAQLLLHHQMDVSTMDQKTQDLRYKTPFDFEIDAMTIVHNVIIFHGVLSTISDQAKQLLRDTQRDVQELQNCKDCFKNYNEKDSKHWFCKPCNPPHILVYAKQTGFPYWPAKVIRTKEDMHEVRFFGNHHQRAEIEKSYVKPISTNIHSLQIKRTSAWSKACEELKRHQDILQELKTNETEAHAILQNSASGSIAKGVSLSPKKTSNEFDSHLLYDCDDDDEDEDDIDSDRVPYYRTSRYDREDNISEPGSSVSSTSKYSSKIRKKESPCENIVSSSSQDISAKDIGIQTSPRLIKILLEEKGAKRFKEREKALRELADKLRQEYENNDQKLLKNTIKEMERDVEKVKEDYKKKINDLKEKHRQNISEVKKKQWCHTCESEAIYHCCWNTAYCSVDCQQEHWHREHKKMCRRQR